MVRRPKMVVPVLVAAGLSLTGCGKAVEKAVETGLEQACKDDPSNKNCDVDLGSDGFSVKTDDGSMSVGKDGQVRVKTDDGEATIGSGTIPAGLPEALRLDAKVLAATTSESTGFAVTYQVDDFAEAMATLRSQVEAAGWEVQADSDMSGSGDSGAFASFSFTGDEGSGSATGSNSATAGVSGQIVVVTLQPPEK